MLFNSYAFLFLYLPAVVAGFFLLGRRSPDLAAGFLALASLGFYALGAWRAVPLLLASVVANYLLGGRIAAARLADRAAAARRWLGLGLALDLGLLGYFKYADFFVASANAALGTTWPLLHVALPLGISFFTFTQVAFLVDVARGDVAEYRFVHYLLFVTYFPHLIAGPILHHKEMMPQFADPRVYRPQAADFAVGGTLFVVGLFKKVGIADGLIPYVHAAFEPAPGAVVDAATAWTGVLAYTFEIYFDFSGYSDMAIGLSRLFGIMLPLNFFSPYRATSISEFWRCWHMTLSRFLRDYVYIPLGGNRHGVAWRHVNLLATMLVGGLWHGASWLFVAWGGLHGLYLVVNHAWRHTGVALPRAAGWALTFGAVMAAWVCFRAPDGASALRVYAGLLGLNGVGTAPWPILAWLAALALVATRLPNVYELLGAWHPVEAPAPAELPRWRWAPTPAWAVACAALALTSLVMVARETEFIYYQF